MIPTCVVCNFGFVSIDSKFGTGHHFERTGELHSAKASAEQALDSALEERAWTVEQTQGQELELDSLRAVRASYSCQIDTETQSDSRRLSARFLQNAGELEQLRGQNALLKRQLARSGEDARREGSDSDSADDESAQVDMLRAEVVSVSVSVQFLHAICCP